MNNISTASTADEQSWPWGKTYTTPRVLHAMIRVSNLDQSLKFYVDGLGMRELYRYEAAPITSVYVGFTDLSAAAIELEYDANGSSFASRGGFGHLSLGFPDLAEVISSLTSIDGKIIVPPTQFLENGPQIALAEDPDGYTVELVQIFKN